MNRIISDPSLFVVFDEEDSTTILKPFCDPLAQFQHNYRDENDKFNRAIHNLVCCEPTLDVSTIMLRRLPDKMLLR